MKWLLLVVFSLGLSACKTVPVKQSMSSDVQLDLSKIEIKGKNLYKAMKSDDATDPPTSREADLLEMASKDLLCGDGYIAVRVEDELSQIEHIYLMFQPEKSKGIQFGRHIRFDFKLGTNDIKSVISSTKSCLLVPLEDSSTDAAFVTHVLSDVPTDFHVYLSLHHKKPIYIRTSSNLWKIENGKILQSK
ncbi:hypothetical protein [Aliikangiella maris]|uniref:Uncharacterized protein n=2 Tax=Aliikangiella maris TaxID=3162458 RepID=A0ABV2BZ72_9GAMM